MTTTKYEVQMRMRRSTEYTTFSTHADKDAAEAAMIEEIGTALPQGRVVEVVTTRSIVASATHMGATDAEIVRAVKDMHR